MPPSKPRADAPSRSPTKGPSPALWIPLACALVGFWWFRGFVQDDAYISLRYAWNLAHGNGLVFNVGEAAEGFSNPSWTLLGAALYFVGVDPLWVLQLLGGLAGLGTVAATYALARLHTSEVGAFVAAMLVASSTTLHAWSPSGLESGFFTLLVTLACLRYSQGRYQQAFLVLGLAQWTRPEALLVAVAMLTCRVLESHEEGRAFDLALARQLGREFLGFAGPAALLFGCRAVYYGALVPNTYLVKGGGNAPSHLLGLRELRELGEFGGNLGLWVVALAGLLPPLVPAASPPEAPPEDGDPAAEEAPTSPTLAWLNEWAVFLAGAAAFFLIHVWLADGGFWKPDWTLTAALKASSWKPGWALTSAVIGGCGVHSLLYPARRIQGPGGRLLAFFWLGFLYYFVRIGGDLLPMHRLFLPAIPAQAVLVVLGAQRLAGPLGLVGLVPASDTSRRAEVRGGVYTVMLLAAGTAVATSMWFSSKQGHFRTVATALDKAHGQAGRDLEALAVAKGFRPTVVAQDMGAFPLACPSMRVVDTIGLTERPVATILRKYRYSPYFRYLIWNDPDWRGRIQAMEAELRDHLAEVVDPEYVVINMHIKSEHTAEARARVGPGSDTFWQPFAESNSFYYGWPKEQRFQARYRVERAYEYSPVHFLVTYRRMDQPRLLPRARPGAAPGAEAG